MTTADIKQLVAFLEDKGCSEKQVCNAVMAAIKSDKPQRGQVINLSIEQIVQAAV